MTGVGLRLRADTDTAQGSVSKYEIVPGRDRYGKPLAKAFFHKDSIVVTRCFSFYDTMRGEFHEVCADIDLSDYKTAKAHVYEVKQGVRRPGEMLSEIINAESAPSVKSLAANLAELACRLELDKVERVVLVQMFVQSLKSVEPVDDLQKNRSAVEVLFDGCGNCVEKSALEAQILCYLGYSSAVLFRYARNLKMTFHSVCGVGFPTYTPAKHKCFFDAEDSDSNYYSNCHTVGYSGSEVTRGRNAKLGCALDWRGGDLDAVSGLNKTHFDAIKDDANPGQVLVVELHMDNGRICLGEPILPMLFEEVV
ncbi:hypothetical protein FACS189490_12540 [Clostridia bacterium]|nr:hypothetical protein FACS189490_12540 [Clostridia bacterium]